eukprot:jgi/Mesvir1/14967/Mv14632-RA.1
METVTVPRCLSASIASSAGLAATSRRASSLTPQVVVPGYNGLRPAQFNPQSSPEAFVSAQRDRPHLPYKGRVQPCTALFGGLSNLFEGGSTPEGTKKKYAGRVAEINALENSLVNLTDEQLRGKTVELKAKLNNGATLDSIAKEAFAVVREASKRVLGLRPFDVQLIGGMLLHEGRIAEMKTGEGKTLVAVLPAYLNALTGKGVHVVTVNDYLARRDCEWVGQVHRYLGLQVGLIQAGMDDAERRASYLCDVTYVTNSELGFDYLRDNLAQTADELVLRPFNYCIVDEVDSILIDEARTPLIISGTAAKPSERYVKAAKIASAFERDVHYKVEEKQKQIILTEEGYEAAEDILQVTDLYNPREQWAMYLINALKAKELQKRDVNYIVRGDEILIVDEFTGRVLPGRRWGEGLHQAVEAKEGVKIQNETVTLASITYQNFFLQYPKMSGMTGTAATEKKEFKNIYNLEVDVVPTNRTMTRKDYSDVVYRVPEGKWNAVVKEVERMHKSGRPVLVGTTSVETSEMLSGLLKEIGIKHQVLNAKPENVEREAEIVAQSGRKGAVTIATNMAGRGTDIILGGNAEYMARLKLREVIMPKIVMSDDDEINFEKGKQLKRKRTWAVSPDLFPVDISAEAKKLLEDAADAAVAAWGANGLEALVAEDRVAVACEKYPTSDPVLIKMRAAFERMFDEFSVETNKEKQEVIELGGLHVVGTERHESRRIDNQLRGRSGRQGDPGSTRFFLSLGDNIFRIFGGDRIQGMMSAFRVEDLPIESDMLTRSLDEAQKKVETYFYDIRKQLFEYDEVLNSQREKLYAIRRAALNADTLTDLMYEYATATMDDILQANVNSTLPPEEWPFETLCTKLKQYCYLLEDITPELLKEKAGGDYEALRAYMHKRGVEAYETRKAAVDKLDPELMQEAERYFVLSQTDRLWQQHLEQIKFIQQAVSLRGYAQKDPLTEYKLEGYNLFVEMIGQIRRNVIYSVYMFQPVAPVKGAGGSKEEGAAGKDKEPAAAGAVSSAGGKRKGGAPQKKKGSK